MKPISSSKQLFAHDLLHVGSRIVSAVGLVAMGTCIGLWVNRAPTQARQCEMAAPVKAKAHANPPPTSATPWRASTPDPYVGLVWASRVVGFSSEWTSSSWSAQQLLGPPNVYPSAGDHSNAWASTSADGQAEFVEVAFGQPQRLQGVVLFETYNPGAVESVIGFDAQGQRHVLFASSQVGPRVAASIMSRYEGSCSSVELVSVRVNLASRASRRLERNRRNWCNSVPGRARVTGT